MDERGDGPAPHFRVERRPADAAMRVLGVFLTLPDAHGAMTRARVRLARAGVTGWLVLIKQDVVPEQEVARLRVGPR